MNSFLLNPLSAQSQFNTTEEAHQAIRDIVNCFKYLSPAIRSKRRMLVVDTSIEYRNILKNTTLIQAIDCLPKKTDKDTKDLWFLYTRKQATKANSESVDITITSTDPACTQSISEISTKDFLVEHCGLISFGGCELTKSNKLHIHSNGQTLTTNNAHALAHVQRLVPNYKASPKHRKDAYTAAGEKVAAMPLPPPVAQEVLLAGLLDDRGDYVGLHGPTGKFIRFKLTEGNDYHGFEVADHEVPDAIRHQLKPKR